MQEQEYELDINKEMTVRNSNQVIAVKYLTDYLATSNYARRSFLVTIKSGHQYTTDRYKNGRLYIDAEDELDIINVTEKPAFSWDKPYRIKQKDFEILLHCFDPSTSTVFPHVLAIRYENGALNVHGFNSAGRSSCGLSLENYQPDSEYYITGPDRLQGYVVHEIYCSEDDQGIAAFESKEDAELFVKVKERGLTKGNF